MDLTTLFGLLMATALLVWSILLNGSLLLFWDMPSAVMVIGGSLAVTIVSYRPADLKGLIKVMLRSMFFRLPTPQQEIERIITYANLARKQGLLALEAKLQEVDDKFFAKGIQLVIDGFAADTVRDIMDLEHSFQQQRHAQGKKMLDTIGTMAPAFGMIGTLVGLVQMLANMSDPSSIGAGMAVALLTTFYGAVIANVFMTPMANKLDLRAKEEALLRSLMIEGIVAIQSGEKPQLIKEKLKGFLPPAAREGVGS
ncbi:MAG: MotA/TolQ/ExbB proton channel family protein [Planctomycetaceae bacterium]|jgi:chemotaxis protein MotA|nr:MotA/TolQ/ExbB proton channel family protein [Planctomycetaceae bacterium]